MRRTLWSASPSTLSSPATAASQILFEPGERRALQGFFWCGGRLVLSILDDLRPVFEALTPGDWRLDPRALTGLPEIGIVIVWPLDDRDRESNGDLLASAQDPLTPAVAAF